MRDPYKAHLPPEAVKANISPTSRLHLAYISPISPYLQARLPPEAVKAMRESAFALLCAFCEGNKRNQAVLLP